MRRRVWLIIALLVLISGFLACGSTETTNTNTQNNSGTLTMEQVVPDDGLGHSVSIQLNSKTNTITVNDDIGEQWDNGAFRDVGKSAIFNIQKDIWQSDLHPNEVIVNILGPLLDKYGNQSTGKMLIAELKSTTAHKFNWDNLYSDSAWDAYDYTWMLPDLENN